MATHSSLLFREFHGQKSLVGYSQWGHKESDMTEQPTLEISHTNIVYLIWFFLSNSLLFPHKRND